MIKKVIYYTLILATAGLMVMPAWGKLSGAPEAVALFQELNLLGQGGAISRIILGAVQALTIIALLFIPRLRKLAAFITMVTMVGAIILVQPVHTMAIVVLVLSLGILVFPRR